MHELIVAYTCNKKKQTHFFNGLCQTATTWQGRYGPSATKVTVRFIPLLDATDLHFHLPQNQQFHAFIHKRTDDMAAAVSGGDKMAASRISKLSQLLQGYNRPLSSPPIVAIDPLEGVWRLVDRRRMSEAIDKAFGRTCKIHGQTVATLPWTIIPLKSGTAAMRSAIEGRLKFPIIVKRRLACGTRASHEMVIAYDMHGFLTAMKVVFGAEDLPENSASSSDSDSSPSRSSTSRNDDFTNGVIAQEFMANHGGVLFKVYAVANNIIVQPRRSVQHTIESPDGGYYYFDSQRLGRAESFDFDATTGYSTSTKAMMPSRNLTHSIIATLSKELGLSLIGVDLVYDLRLKCFYIVDINYFPGYKGVNHAYEWILQHICDRVWQSSQRELF